MTAPPAQATVPGPVESLEVRWLFPGRPTAAVADWFARFPAGTQTLEDIYLIRPWLGGLSVKLRDRRVLDVKSYLGSPGVLELPGRGRGRLESWQKVSFPYGPPGQDDGVMAGWIMVGKARRNAWFPLAAGHDPPGVRGPGGGAGCTAELTEVDAGREPWWSVGFEATGTAGLLHDALQHAVGLVFARGLPEAARLELDNSMSYVEWLHQRSGTGSA